MERHLSVRATPEIAEKQNPSLRFSVLGSAELSGANASELRAALVQPKRLALLTYLALARPRGFQRRDALLGLFWPESDNERARHALRQAVHTLRRAMGNEVIVSRGDSELSIDHAAIWCDARAFEEALDAGETERALSLYRGDLLPGFFVSNASAELEQWLDAERSRLKARASSAAWTLASLAEREGDGSAAARWGRRGLAFSPDDESSLRRLIALLDRLGDRAGALRAHDDFSRGLAAEFEAEPSAETKALIDAIRARHRARENGIQEHEPDRAVEQMATSAAPIFLSRLPDGGAESSEREEISAPRRLRRTFAITSGIVAALAIVAFEYARARDGRAESNASAPVVAVGKIVEPGLSATDTLGSANTLRELLATDLARVSGLHVVSHSRLYEVLGQIGRREPTQNAISDAARRAGATELLEGVLYRRPGNPSIIRLDLRRIELATGVVSRAWSAEGTDLFSLADSVTSQFASALRLPRPALALAGVTSNSLVARRFYEQGMRSFYQGEGDAASRYFVAALDEDSTFGMAAFYATMSPSIPVRRRAIPLLAQAVRRSSAVPERERLLMRYLWAQLSNDPSTLAFAESLAVRYPNEPNGERLWGQALFWFGDFEGAIPHLRRAVAGDSLGFSRSLPGTLCPACDAMSVIVFAHLYADSIAAAEQAARRWIEIQPGSPLPRLALAEVLARGGRRAEALTEAALIARTSPALVRDAWLDVRLALAAGDFAEAHRLLGIRSQDIDEDVRQDALWWTVITLRYEGRLAAAGSALNLLCLRAGLQPGAGNSSLECSLAMGPVLFERGKYHEAARLYESIPLAKEYQRPAVASDMLGLASRHWSSMLTHAGSAYAAAGDTARLRSLADSVEKWGRLSSFGRDRRIHFHLRGLLSASRGRHMEAVAFFRRAIYSLSDGYTRTNLELARELIAVGKAPEAVGILRSGLRGPIQSGNLYVTQTELHEMLARAFEQSGSADSAAVHYRRVAAAWRKSDPAFRGRAMAALAKSESRR